MLEEYFQRGVTCAKYTGMGGGLGLQCPVENYVHNRKQHTNPLDLLTRQVVSSSEVL